MKTEKLLLITNVKGDMRSSEMFGILHEYNVIPLSEGTFYFEYPIDDDPDLKTLFTEISSKTTEDEDFLVCGIRTPSTGLMTNNEDAVSALRKVGLWPSIDE